MQQTTNYNLNKFDSTDELESATRLGLNENADTIDTALKGIQDDIDGLDASEVSYDNTVSGLTATDVQAALDEELGKIDILSNYSTTEQVIGKWIDGKPLYRKVATFTSVNISSQAFVDTPVSNTNVKALFECWGTDDNGSLWPLGANRTGADYIRVWNFRNATIAITGLILTYTKTTD